MDWAAIVSVTRGNMMRLAPLLFVVAILQGCGGEREIHPGLDFPAAWLPEGIDKQPHEILEEAQARLELSRKKSNFRSWCEKHGFDVDEAAIDSLEFVGGRWVSKTQRLERPSAAEFDSEQTFAGQKWTLVGPAEPNGNLFRLGSMQAMWYTAGDDNVRLIDEKWDKLRSARPTGYERIMQVQVLRNGRWINHGPMSRWDPKGWRDETHYRDGEPHGTQRAWYSSGQLRIEREWRNGKEHGVDRGWHEDGTPSYEVHYVAGVKVSGSSWREDGTPYPSGD